MNKYLCCAVLGAALSLSACASSQATVVKKSNLWSTSCGAGNQGVDISAPTLVEFHSAVEKAPECARGYTASAPSN